MILRDFASRSDRIGRCTPWRSLMRPSAGLVLSPATLVVGFIPSAPNNTLIVLVTPSVRCVARMMELSEAFRFHMESQTSSLCESLSNPQPLSWDCLQESLEKFSSTVVRHQPEEAGSRAYVAKNSPADEGSCSSPASENPSALTTPAPSGLDIFPLTPLIPLDWFWCGGCLDIFWQGQQLNAGCFLLRVS